MCLSNAYFNIAEKGRITKAERQNDRCLLNPMYLLVQIIHRLELQANLREEGTGGLVSIVSYSLIAVVLYNYFVAVVY